MSYMRISRCMQRRPLRITSRRVRAGTLQFLQPGLRQGSKWLLAPLGLATGTRCLSHWGLLRVGSQPVPAGGWLLGLEAVSLGLATRSGALFRAMA